MIRTGACCTPIFLSLIHICIKVWHRIFRHLIPNVIPQLIVTCTMGLGSTILTEATLSFLGLGVKYPFASWEMCIRDRPMMVTRGISVLRKACL